MSALITYKFNNLSFLNFVSSSLGGSTNSFQIKAGFIKNNAQRKFGR